MHNERHAMSVDENFKKCFLCSKPGIITLCDVCSHNQALITALQAAPKKEGYSYLDDLRVRGWSVAVHNDYKQDDMHYTFWLFTKGYLVVKGEGLNDVEALMAAWDEVMRLKDKGGG